MKNVVKLSLLFVACALVACGSKTAPQPEEPSVDYDAIVTKEFPSVETFAELVDNFQIATKQLIPTGTNWDQNEKKIKGVIEPLGFKVSRNDDMGFSIRSSKNCRVSIDFDPMIEPTNADSLSAAICFISCGDMYVKGEIVVADSCIYNALLEKVKAAGYQRVQNDEFENQAEEKYEKGYYYFSCNKNRKALALHYDFMKEFE